MTEYSQEDYKRRLCGTFRHFIEICEKHGLQYYACAGTCLGAVRHKGMIPWDDDVDVCMPRRDFEKLMALGDTLRPDFEIVDYHTPYYCEPFAKFCDAGTTVVETPEFPAIFGVYVDIFPMDEVGDEAVAYKLQRRKNKYFARYRGTFRILTPGLLAGMISRFEFRSLAAALYYATIGRHRRDRYLAKYLSVESLIQTQRGDKCMYYGGFYGFRRELCDKKWFGRGKKVPFEDFTVTVPEDSDAYLTQFYGDYMVPPPVEFRGSHHSRLFVDLGRRLSREEFEKMKLHTSPEHVVRYDW